MLVAIIPTMQFLKSNIFFCIFKENCLQTNNVKSHGTYHAPFPAPKPCPLLSWNLLQADAIFVSCSTDLHLLHLPCTGSSTTSCCTMIVQILVVRVLLFLKELKPYSNTFEGWKILNKKAFYRDTMM